MRIALALLVLLWSTAAAAQQFGEQTRSPVPSGGPPPTGGPPPPGARGPAVPEPPPVEAERVDDPAATPPAVTPPELEPTDAPVDVTGRPAVPPPGAATEVAKRAVGPNVVKVHDDQNGYVLLVDGKPTMVFGMNWGYMPIGENYAYDFWGKPDDFIIDALEDEMRWLKEMGVNVIRQYAGGMDGGPPPRWIKYIYEKYGIYTALNHSVGRYGMTIDGVWVSPVDYSDERFRALMKEQITGLVEEYKDTPGVLMWLLGNENNYGLYWKSNEIEDLPEAEQGDARAVFLYSLFGELTDTIHGLDENHPVAIANGDLGFIDVIKKEAPNIDILGSNVYRGASSGDIFERTAKELGKPFMYTCLLYTSPSPRDS